MNDYYLPENDLLILRNLISIKNKKNKRWKTNLRDFNNELRIYSNPLVHLLDIINDHHPDTFSFKLKTFNSSMSFYDIISGDLASSLNLPNEYFKKDRFNNRLPKKTILDNKEDLLNVIRQVNEWGTDNLFKYLILEVKYNLKKEQYPKSYIDYLNKFEDNRLLRKENYYSNLKSAKHQISTLIEIIRNKVKLGCDVSNIFLEYQKAPNKRPGSSDDTRFRLIDSILLLEYKEKIKIIDINQNGITINAENLKKELPKEYLVANNLNLLEDLEEDETFFIGHGKKVSLGKTSSNKVRYFKELLKNFNKYLSYQNLYEEVEEGEYPGGNRKNHECNELIRKSIQPILKNLEKQNVHLKTDSSRKKGHIKITYS